jgi:transcriptional regulator with XRE-family HTH domain
MDIGHRICQARIAAGMSQTELAKAVGVSRGLVGQWENHTKKPGRDVLQRVAAVTSVSIRFLLGDERIQDGSLVISNPDEAALIRRYRTLTDRQKRGIRDLVGLTATLPD